MLPRSPIKTPLELYTHLPRTNCGKCGMTTCLAFAAAVLRGEKLLADCPFLNAETAACLEAAIGRRENMESIREEQLRLLKQKLTATDILSRAELLGARRSGKRLVVRCLGKDFEIDANGDLSSQCHTHAWFSLPLLDHVLHSRGLQPSGRWVPFRELAHGRTWGPLFEQRCERPLKRIADSYSDLFADLVGMFSGTSSVNVFGSDVSVTLHPFPKVPLLICYWRTDDGMDSKLHLFFDDTAEGNLPIESLFSIGTGIARMLEMIMHRHTDGKSELS